MKLDQISKPTLLLDRDRCNRNIDRMMNKVASQGITLRPHFKTHQSHEVGRWFRDRGTDKITVSSIGMARYFFEDGWKDITIAFPVNTRQIEELKELAQKCTLGLVVVNPEAVVVLGNELASPVNIWIKIDVGTHRTGILPDHPAEVDSILDALKKYPHLHFAGFLGHAGHSYQNSTLEGVQKTYDLSIQIFQSLVAKYKPTYPDLKTSLGDTPSTSMVQDLRGVDELRPGNFVFYDLQQEEIGSCTYDDVAVALACPVVAVHPDRKQWIIYGGGIHFAKDFTILPDGRKCFGRMVIEKENGWSAGEVEANPFLVSISQEHGVVQCTEENYHWKKPGDLTLWLPVHSCMTADIMAAYLSTDGVYIDHYRKHCLE